MAIVAGIDEAGYGPLLGPLVVGVAAFRVPEERVAADLWRLFKIGRAGDKKTAGGVKVADSKALHKGPHGLRTLEENLLPFFDLPDKPAPSFMALLRNLGADNADCLRSYPWYRDAELKLPHRANPQRIIDRATQLRRALSGAGAEFCSAAVQVLNVAQFNRDVAETDNKSATSAKCVAVLLNRLWDDFGLEGVNLVVDKQGGRDKYKEFLGVVFPDCEIAIDLESAEESRYQVIDGPVRMAITFKPRADRDRLPVALASMMCKYVRELFMLLLNSWWRERVPELKPTAGYVVDGGRFVEDIKDALREHGIDTDLLVRSR